MTTIILLDVETNKLVEVEAKNAIVQLYFLKVKVPSVEDVKKNKGKLRKEFDPDIEQKIKMIRMKLSKQSEKIPLYDFYSDNIYIVTKENVYERVTKSNYRFPNKIVLNDIHVKAKILKKNIAGLEEETLNKEIGEVIEKTDKKSVEKYNSLKTRLLELRKYRKYNLMLNFMKSFYLDTLFMTFTKIFYLYGVDGKNITTCKRPSYATNLFTVNPYYSRSEIINIALNMELIKPDNTYYDSSTLEKLCSMVSKNDIHSGIILSHQKHIADNDRIGLIQFYTFFGSYVLNRYLRNQTKYIEKNTQIENIAGEVWKLVLGAPAFDKNYKLYRFLETDDHLSHLKIGDIYTEQGFTSTTRDPFYKSSDYKFGFILVKISIPPNVPGVALSVESYSNFPKEQEVIFAPMTNFKLVRKDSECPYYHTEPYYANKIKTRYEFEYVNSEQIQFPRTDIMQVNLIKNFRELEQPESNDIYEHITRFTTKYVNEARQFNTYIGKKLMTVTVEYYDSSGPYKDFYMAETREGIMMYCYHDNYLLFMIEITLTSNNIPMMAVNYYLRSTTNTIKRKNIVDDTDFIDFVSDVSFWFGIDTVYLFADYFGCDSKNVENESPNNTYGGVFCVDFYDYFKTKQRRFKNISDISAGFSYTNLDKLFTMSPYQIISKETKTELYQIYDKVYHNNVDKNLDNVALFYVWLCDHHCYLVNVLVNEIDNKLGKYSPFRSDFYRLDPIAYLYNAKKIATFPMKKLMTEVVYDVTTKRREKYAPRNSEVNRRSEQRAINNET